MKKTLSTILFLFTALLVAGQTRDYIIQPGDLLSIEVFGQPDLSRQVRISQNRTINLPLIGELAVKSFSTAALTEEIRKRYDADFLVNPNVNVRVMEYTELTVNVMGAVNQAGAVKFPPEGTMNVMDAITKAGGFNRMANRKQVRITREQDGKTEVFIVDTEQILRGLVRTLQLMPSDTIFIAESTF